MKISIGIVGLPNVGKSSLFQLIAQREVNVANYPFATIDPNVGVVAVKDERLEKIAEIMRSKEILPAVFEFMDIAGLVRGAHQGEGLGNQFLAQIRECDAIIHLVRIFQDDSIIHFEGRLDPLADFEAVENELKMKDEESKEKENLLRFKPQLVILNGKESEAKPELIQKLTNLARPYLIWDLKTEAHQEKLKEIFESIKTLLDLVVFFTANSNEARSWFIKKGTIASQAAGLIHTDFEKKFIRAEVIDWDKLKNIGSWIFAKQMGKIRTEGRDYIINEGDVIEIKHG